MSGKQIVLLIGILLLLIMGILYKTLVMDQDLAPAQNAPDSTSASAASSQSLTPPPMTIDKTKKYSAALNTSVGTIVVQLNSAEAPITVNNFIYLAGRGFYNNTIFHRVIKGFMIQGGDPKGDGTGGPGYQFDDEPTKGNYTRGVVAMANSGPNTNGSQFFIMHQDQDLPPNYVIFGQVTGGLDILDKIANAPVRPSRTGEDSQPVNPVSIISVEISQI